MDSNSLVGHGAALIRRFTDDLHRSFGGPPLARARRERLDRHRVSDLRARGAGGSFDVLLVDEEGRATGYIVRVEVTYSRFDADAANSHGPGPR